MSMASAIILYGRKAYHMTEIIQWMMGHQMMIMTIAFWLFQGMVICTVLVTARRVRMMKKEMDKVGVQVRNYLDAILEEEEDKEEHSQERSMEEIRKMQRDEEENRIISTVLQEIFP